MTDLEVIEIAEGYEPTSHEVALVSQTRSQLITAESPDEFVERAAELARALAAVIEKQGLFKQLGPKKHVTVEGWTTLGSMLGAVGVGVYAVPDGEPQEVEIEGVKGVKASMKAVTADGTVIGGATGYCMRNEANWRSKDFYALAGMAQTRATSRALRQPLGWIVALAGFAATPLEEMEGGQQPKPKPKAKKLDSKLNAEFLSLQKVLVDSGDERWLTENVLASASRKFGREIAKVAELSDEEMKAIIEGANEAITVAELDFGEGEKE